MDNNQYKQLGKIFLGETRKPEAPVTAVKKGKKTTKAQGQEAMAADPDHPADRGRAVTNLKFKRKHLNCWTTYKRIGSILGEEQVDHFSKENVAAAKKRKAETEALAKKRKGVKHSTDEPIISLKKK